MKYNLLKISENLAILSYNIPSNNICSTACKNVDNIIETELIVEINRLSFVIVSERGT